jgi:exopolysaccharide biosynthesis polyprenyl glycosylphosphotransferase
LRYYTLLIWCVIFGDAVILATTLRHLAQGLRFVGGASLAGAENACVIAGLAISFILASHLPIYDRRRLARWWPSSVVAVCPLAAGIAVVAVLIADAQVPLVAVWQTSVESLLLGAAALALFRLLVKNIIERGIQAGLLTYKVALLGTEAARLANQLDAENSPFLEVEFIEDGTLSVRNLTAYARRHSLDAIILAYRPDNAEQMKVSLAALRSVVPDILAYSGMGRCGALPKAHPLGCLPLMSLQKSPLRDLDIVLKSAMDRLGGIALVFLLSPLLIATAISLESPGPIFFVQPRFGYNNRVFKMFKFRSMYHHQRDSRAKCQTVRDDRRVTKVGRFIRRWSLDELPQLFNVIRGEMSLVGPRPHAPGTSIGGLLLNQVHAEYEVRHRVLPGITGWAQVNGSRGLMTRVADVERRVRLDLEYIDQWSIMLDLKILLMTITSAAHSSQAF